MTKGNKFHIVVALKEKREDFKLIRKVINTMSPEIIYQTKKKKKNKRKKENR